MSLTTVVTTTRPNPPKDGGEKFDNDQDDEFVDSIGASLNLGVNALADVLHTFFLDVVEED